MLNMVLLSGMLSSGASSWSLVSLILTIGCVIVSILLLVSKTEQYIDEESDLGEDFDIESLTENNSTKVKRMPAWKICGIQVGLIAVIQFLMTNSFKGQMILINKWALTSGILFVISLCALIFGRKWYIED